MLETSVQLHGVLNYGRNLFTFCLLLNVYMFACSIYCLLQYCLTVVESELPGCLLICAADGRKRFEKCFVSL